MQKRVFQTALSFILILLILPIASAEIIFSNPNQVYSAGDSFSLSMTLAPNAYTSDFLITSIICGTKSVEIYKSPHTLSQGGKKQIDFSFNFDSFLVSELEGQCKIKANYAKEESFSQTFTISRNIDISISTNSNSFSPSDEIIVSGIATKSNSQTLNGFVEVSIQGANISEVSTVSNVNFEVSLKIPEDYSQGTKILLIKTYEKNSNGETINSGTKEEAIIINQIPKSIDIALETTSVVPGSDLNYKIIIIDQTGSEMSLPVNLSLISPNGKMIKSNQVLSQDDLVLSTETNYIHGTWVIEVSSSGLQNKRKITIEELAVLSYDIEEDKLRVTNIGNINYNKKINVKIAGKLLSIDVDLAPGKSKLYQLSAPSGSYDIEVSSPDGSSVLPSVSLTGSAVSIDGVTFGVKSSTLRILIWAIIILVLAIVAYALYKKVARKDFIGKIPKFSKKENYKDISNQSYQIEGKREKSSVIALKIKNLQELESNNSAIQTIDSALLSAKELKAKIYISENYRIIILSPIITKKEDNYLSAVEISQKIKELIDGYNGKHERKIKYGLAVHTGELVVESKEGKFAFTSVGSVVSMVKNLASNSESEILLSTEFHKKTVGRIKVEKISPKIWKLRSLKSKHNYEEFINRFEARQKARPNKKD